MSTPATQSFRPQASKHSGVLILGSHPGQRSLEAHQYYAHPRNRFWPLMQSLFGIPADAPYEQRMTALNLRGIALWDVLGECVRPGSLDSDIKRHTERANPILQWLDDFPDIQTLAFNGQAAEQAFKRHFPQAPKDLKYLCLPSTSPANARWQHEALLEAWSQLRKK